MEGVEGSKGKVLKGIHEVSTALLAGDCVRWSVAYWKISVGC